MICHMEFAQYPKRWKLKYIWTVKLFAFGAMKNWDNISNHQTSLLPHFITYEIDFHPICFVQNSSFCNWNFSAHLHAIRRGRFYGKNGDCHGMGKTQIRRRCTVGSARSKGKYKIHIVWICRDESFSDRDFMRLFLQLSGARNGE